MERWEAINAVQRVQDYIENHIKEPITLNQLAKAAGYSQWHTIRLFKDLLGKTPFEYLRAIRLSKAAILLRDKQPRIIDVAFDYVFDSHEGFTRAFTRQFGLSPKDYRQHPRPIPLFTPHRARDGYLTIQKGGCTMSKSEHVNTVFVQVVERPERKVILKRGIKATHYFEYCEEVGCDVWDVLTSIKGALYEPIGMWLPEKMIREGTSKYVQGVEMPTDFKGEIPVGFEVIDLPPCRMMVFQGEPYDDEKYGAAIEALWDVMKRYNPQTYGFEWADDDAPRFQLAPMGYRGYIEARPVRPVNEA